jgi:putative CocE/NonD family hydrolase
VLTYETEPLDEDLVIAGPVRVSLNVSSTGTDSDFVVKLVDVYPGDYPQAAPPEGQRPPPNFVRMGGYQQLVRGEPFRAKFREGFERAVPLAPGKPARIEFAMPDVYHAFRRGHRVMVQVQSSWFPLVDRNPQKFMEIPKAGAADFQRATQRVYRSRGLGSSVTLMVEQGTLRTLQPAR